MTLPEPLDEESTDPDEWTMPYDDEESDDGEETWQPWDSYDWLDPNSLDDDGTAEASRWHPVRTITVGEFL